MMNSDPDVGLEMTLDEGMPRSGSAIVPVSVPLGSTSRVKLRFAAITWFPTTNGLTLPASGVILLSVARPNG